MALYDSVAQRYPDDHLADDALFMSAYIDPYPQGAIAKYQRLREQYPESEHDLGALYHLLQLYRKVGDYAMASNLCQEFMERYPDSYYSQTVFLNYVSNLLMAGEKSAAINYVLEKAQTNRQLRDQFPSEYRDLPTSELWSAVARPRVAMVQRVGKVWIINYEKDSTSQNSRKLIQSYLDNEANIKKAIAILDIAIPGRNQPVFSKLDSLYFTTELFQEFHVTKALQCAYDNLRRGNYVQAANISLGLINNPLIRDPSEAYWILGQAYPRYDLPSMAFQSLKRAFKGLVSPEDRMACLDGMIKYAPESTTVEAILREAVRDTTFSNYERVKLATRLMGLLNIRNADLSEIETVSNALSDLDANKLGPVHRTLASIYFGRGLLGETEKEVERLVDTAPDEAVHFYLRCALYQRYVNNDQRGSRSLLDKALGICSQAGLQRQQSEVLALIKEW
jgi:tetratricopeptide (TPR) repeat protein